MISTPAIKWRPATIPINAMLPNDKQIQTSDICGLDIPTLPTTQKPVVLKEEFWRNIAASCHLWFSENNFAMGPFQLSILNNEATNSLLNINLPHLCSDGNTLLVMQWDITHTCYCYSYMLYRKMRIHGLEWVTNPFKPYFALSLKAFCHWTYSEIYCLQHYHYPLKLRNRYPEISPTLGFNTPEM